MKDHAPKAKRACRRHAEKRLSINKHSREAKRLLRNGDTECIEGGAEPQGLTHLPCQPSGRMTSSGRVLFRQQGAGLRRVEMHMESPCRSKTSHNMSAIVYIVEAV